MGMMLMHLIRTECITDRGLSPVARARMDTRTVWRRDLDDDPDGDFD
jgi:hypothetical protein